MEEELSYLQELMVEKDSLDPAFVHAQRLLSREISRVKELGDSVKTEEEGSDMNSQATSYNGKPTSPMAGSEPPNSSQDSQGKQPGSRKYRRPGEYVTEDVIKLSEKVIVPVKEFPKFNFVGKLLGPRGNTLKRLQAQTGTKMSVLGKGSMRDKEKEDELRDSGDPKYAHLTDPLHVLIEVEGVQSEAHLRLAGALSEIKKYMTPENDDIRVQQMQEMAYLQSLENHDTVPPLPPQMTAMTMTQIPIAAQPVVRGRARPVLRGAPAAMARGIRGVRVPSAAHRGGRWVGVRMPIPVSRSLGRAIVTHVAAPRHAAQAPGHRAEPITVTTSSEYETYDPTYDSAYDAAYAEGATESVYYDYSGAEAYEYAPTSSAGFQTSTTYKAQPVRQMKRVAREATYPY
ncbi:KH domain-containing, RNA-binding, signal transduction-associated protein 2-like isoform X2 [Rhopilema esculentum]|uniref:KH domain-containing, RNA-binding, signal transduction-associated protein 2-like isoform X2 n=1 Tax=Rhopilema esculentum TaxID=499914 RepID=UPI0031DECD9E